MGFQSNASTEAASASHVPHPEEDFGLSPETLDDIQMVRVKRTNLLVIGERASTRAVLDMLQPGPPDGIVTWRPGQPLDLPSPGRATTLVLHDVDQLTTAAQGAVLRWLNHSAGHIWVVSTTAAPLWPQVQAGAFSDVLYYRLNIVCVHLGLGAD